MRQKNHEKKKFERKKQVFCERSITCSFKVVKAADHVTVDLTWFCLKSVHPHLHSYKTHGSKNLKYRSLIAWLSEIHSPLIINWCVWSMCGSTSPCLFPTAKYPKSTQKSKAVVGASSILLCKKWLHFSCWLNLGFEKWGLLHDHNWENMTSLSITKERAESFFSTNARSACSKSNIGCSKKEINFECTTCLIRHSTDMVQCRWWSIPKPNIPISLPSNENTPFCLCLLGWWRRQHDGDACWVSSSDWPLCPRWQWRRNDTMVDI